MTGLIVIPTRPNLAGPPAEFWQSVLALQTPPGTQINPYPGFFAHHNRTAGVRDALAGGADWVFFVDDDQLFAPDALLRLLDRRVDIVTCNLLCKEMPYPPYLFERIDGHGPFPMHLETQRGLVPVDACGLGGVLVRTSVFQTIPEPWFDVSERFRTDDLWFCDHARAAGLSIVCDVEVPSFHMIRGAVGPRWNPDIQRWETELRIHHGGRIAVPAATRSPEYAAWLAAHREVPV